MSVPMMAMTTSSSTSVKPLFLIADRMVASPTRVITRDDVYDLSNQIA
jgi:hypothetical protein